RFGFVIEPLIPEGTVAERVVIPVVAELDVPAVVPGESLWIDVARGETSGTIGALDHRPAVVPQLGKAIRCAEACWPGAENHDAAWIVHSDGLRNARKVHLRSDRHAGGEW